MRRTCGKTSAARCGSCRFKASCELDYGTDYRVRPHFMSKRVVSTSSVAPATTFF